MGSHKKQIKSNEYRIKIDLHRKSDGKVISKKGAKYFLSEGFYYSKDDKIIFGSTNKTRKIMEYITDKNRNDGK